MYSVPNAIKKCKLVRILFIKIKSIFGKCLCISYSKRKDGNPFFNKHFYHKYGYGNNIAEQFYEFLQMCSETIENITNNSE